MRTNPFSSTHEVVKPLRFGGMAEVYLALNRQLRRQEVIKLLKLELTSDRSLVERFISEARMSANLNHPNIVSIYSVAGDGPDAAIAMEYIPGEELTQYMARHGRLNLKDALVILKQLAAALDYAHSRRILHRDIKPDNILLTQVENSLIPKIVDFGIARALEDDSGHSLTRTGMIIGTPNYMSPEQAGSGGDVGPATDQYALAVIAYEMLTGRPPFSEKDGFTTVQVLTVKCSKAPPDPLMYDSGLGPVRRDVLLRGLSIDPKRRYPSCRSFIESLESSIAVPPTPEVPDKGPGNSVGDNRQSTFLIVSIAVLAIFGLSLAVYAVTSGSPTGASGGDSIDGSASGGNGIGFVQNEGASTAGSNSTNPSGFAPNPPPEPEPQEIQEVDFVDRFLIADELLLTASETRRASNRDNWVENLVDGDRETAWQTPAGGREAQSVTIKFADGQRKRVVGIEVIPGYDKNKADRYGDRWTLNTRTKLASVTMGEQTLETPLDAESKAFQKLRIPDIAGVSIVKVRFSDFVYGTAKNEHDLCISELRIKVREPR